MDETWKALGEYTARAFTSDNWQTTALLISIWLSFCLIAYYHSARYAERAVSKRSIRARRKEVQNISEEWMTQGLEEAINRNLLTREEVDKQYERLRTAGFKDIGIEPTFGRPWYCPTIPPSVTLLKSQILTRLYRMGVDINQKLKRSKPPRKIDKLQATFKRV